MTQEDHVNRTAVDISLLLTQGQYNVIRAICSIHTTSYMIEVYRKLSKSKKDKLSDIVSSKLH